MPAAIDMPSVSDEQGRSKSTLTDGARSSPTPRGLGRFAWGVLAYNLLVIAWGAYVRASGSGAGCGRHWPLCNGELVPRAGSAKTLVEVSHRASAGLAMIGVVALMVWTLRAMPRGHRARRASIFSTAFIFGEALIGAALVLFELVAKDESMKRGLSMVLHLGNTFFLLGALTVTAWTLTRDSATAAARGPVLATLEPASSAPSPLLRGGVFLALGAVLVLGCSGAIAALGDTLFPATSLRAGIAMDLSPLAHVFLRLRVLHPVLALAAGGIVFVMASVTRVSRPSPRVRTFSRALTLLFALQFGVGLANVTLLAPIGMQIVHLLMADAMWIALVLMAWEALYARPPSPAVAAQSPIMSRNGPAPMSDVPPSTSNVDPVT
jgi:heme A synthase